MSSQPLQPAKVVKPVVAPTPAKVVAPVVAPAVAAPAVAAPPPPPAIPSGGGGSFVSPYPINGPDGLSLADPVSGEPPVNQLFRTVLKHKGSDLHLKAGLPGAMRLRGGDPADADQAVEVRTTWRSSSTRC